MDGERGLMAKVARGDQAAFADLAQCYSGKMLAVAGRLLGSRAEPASTREEQIIRIPLAAGGEVPVSLVAELAGCGVRVTDLQLHRPTLEDVFLHLTGQPVRGAPARRRGRGR